MRLLLDLSIISLVFWAVGIGFLPVEDHRFFDSRNLISNDALSVIGMIPIIMFATGAVSGAILERTRIAPLLVFSAISSIVFPICFQFGQKYGYVGAEISIAPLYGGAAALLAARLAGPRKGKYNRDLSVNFIPGHNVLFQMLGVLMFFVGLIVISRSPMGMVLATSAATLTSSLLGKLKFGKVDTGLTLAGMAGGICCSTAGFQEAWIGALTGAIAGVLIPLILIQIEIRFRIDDVAASSATHLVGGLLGAIVAILQAQFGPHDPNFSLVKNLLFVLFVIAAGAAVSFAVFNIFAKIGKLRVSESAEFDGTDLSELDLNAYPDFQQTMIKSYHLREV